MAPPAPYGDDGEDEEAKPLFAAPAKPGGGAAPHFWRSKTFSTGGVFAFAAAGEAAAGRRASLSEVQISAEDRRGVQVSAEGLVPRRLEEGGDLKRVDRPEAGPGIDRTVTGKAVPRLAEVRGGSDSAWG